MKQLLSIVILPISISLTNCASIKDSILLGSGVGSVAGAGLGTLAGDHSTKGTLIGLGVGAAVGAGLGYLAHKEKKKKESIKDLPSPLLKNGYQYPFSLTDPKVKILKIKTKIEGNKVIEGHRVFILENPIPVLEN